MFEKFNSDTFVSQKNFYDDENFPYGFHRSGDFTIDEANILTSHGNIMTKLHKGDIAPTTPEHKHFLQVVNGTISAKYFEELAYIKYLQVRKNKNRYIPALTKVIPNKAYVIKADIEDIDIENDDDDNIEDVDMEDTNEFDLEL